MEDSNDEKDAFALFICAFFTCIEYKITRFSAKRETRISFRSSVPSASWRQHERMFAWSVCFLFFLQYYSSFPFFQCFKHAHMCTKISRWKQKDDVGKRNNNQPFFPSFLPKNVVFVPSGWFYARRPENPRNKDRRRRSRKQQKLFHRSSSFAACALICHFLLVSLLFYSYSFVSLV